jgi:nitroreductase
MKKKFKKYLPNYILYKYRKIKYSIQILIDYTYDFRRFAHFVGSTLASKNSLEAFIIKEYHAVEKGLSLPNPRLEFGKARIERLVEVLKSYLKQYPFNETIQIALETLEEYKEFNNSRGVFTDDLDSQLNELKSYIELFKNERKGGTKLVSKSEVFNATNIAFSEFVRARHSIRDFSEEKVDERIVLDAINDARFTPSVCNRQAWKVYLILDDNKALIDRYLNVQNGNKGFGDDIKCLLVVTGRVSSFFEYERNQIYVDGGMFAMSLVYALHARGLGSCCLNTSYKGRELIDFLNVHPLDADTVPIMFIAVGHLKENYRVACSYRKPLDEIVTVIRGGY